MATANPYPILYLLILSFLHEYPASSQHLQITNLAPNPGLLTLQDGYSFLKIGEHKLFHVINLENYEPIFRKLETNVNGINSLGNYSEMTELLKTKLTNTLRLFSELQPRARPKRGLFNFVGTGIKEITGNLDENDLIEISKDIQELNFNAKILINENNEQRKINFQFQDRINRIVKQLKDQQVQISKNLISARNDLTRKNFIIFKEIIKIHFNLDLLKNHLEDIFEAIKLAKLQILSKNILSSEELNFATERLEEKGVSVNSLEETYDYLELSAYHNNSNIIFVISIPLLENQLYENFYLEPLPVGNKILKTLSTHAMRSNESTFIIIKDCKRIQKGKLCDQNNVANITTDECIPNLLQGRSANCPFTDCINPTEVKLITGNLLVLKKVKSLEINSTCGLTNRYLTGSYLIKFHNCSIHLNGSKFENTEVIRAESPLVLPLDGLTITESHFESTIRLEDIHINNRKFLEDFTKSHRIQTYSSFTMSTLSFLTMITAVMIVAWKVIHRKRKFVSEKPNSDMEENRKELRITKSEAYTNRDDSFLKDGLVNDGLSPQLQDTQKIHQGVQQLQQQQQ